MVELLQKFLWLFKEWVTKLEEDKQEEAIKKFKEASDLSKDLEKEAWKTSESLQKFLLTDEWKEILKKYVDLYISASDVRTLKDEINLLIDKVETLSSTVEKFQKEKESDDETLSKTIDETLDRVEKLEELAKTRHSKQD